MAGSPEELLHASTVVVDGQAVLIMGPSGSGKSDLALRLIDRGAGLLSDDYTRVAFHDGELEAAPAPNIAGKIEVRGVGIIKLPFVQKAQVALVVTLGDSIERLPQSDKSISILGKEVRAAMLNGLEPSAPIKVEMALRQCLTEASS